MRDDEYTEFSVVEVKFRGPKAILVETEDGEEKWIPLSLIDLDVSEATEKGDSGMISVKQWFAKKEGLV